MRMRDYVRMEGHELPGLDPESLRKAQEAGRSPTPEPAVFETEAF